VSDLREGIAPDFILGRYLHWVPQDLLDLGTGVAPRVRNSIALGWVKKKKAPKRRHGSLNNKKNLCRPFRARITLIFSWGLYPRLCCIVLSALKS
jgi:hypothetical protein